ncbi:MAG: hypothetical protein ABSD71_14280 [Bacteroidales bacterium]|jgi:hypothetical protein
MLEKYIKNNLSRAISEQFDIRKDFIIVKEIKNNELTNKTVYGWMKEYGLFQGINDSDRNKIVAIFCEKYAELKSNGLSTIENYDLLFTSMVKTVYWSWVSASSKLLWCVYPNDVVIYDSFVERAILVLQPLEDVLKNKPRIGERPLHKQLYDTKVFVEFYSNYSDNILRLYDKYQDIIEEGCKKYRGPNQQIYPYGLRVFDKLLWMLGNPKFNDFKV